jgi:hypothetical protein
MLISGYCEEKRPTIRGKRDLLLEAKETYVCVWVQHSKLTDELVRVCVRSVCVCLSVCLSVCLGVSYPEEKEEVQGGEGGGGDRCKCTRFQRGREGERAIDRGRKNA